MRLLEGEVYTCIIVSVGTVTTSDRKSREAFSVEAVHFALMLGEKIVSVLLTATVMLDCGVLRMFIKLLI